MRRLPAGCTSTSSSAPSAQPSSRRPSARSILPGSTGLSGARRVRQIERAPSSSCRRAPLDAASARTRACCTAAGPCGSSSEVVAAELGRVARLADLRHGRERSGGSRGQRTAEQRCAELERAAVGVLRGLLRREREGLVGRDRPGVERLDEQDHAGGEIVLTRHDRPLDRERRRASSEASTGAG